VRTACWFREAGRENEHGGVTAAALEPSSAMLGREYAKDTEAESGHHLHIRARRGPAVAHQGRG
jgi:hypothetical protein